MLTNGTLPAGEIQKVDAQEITYGFTTTEFTENIKFDIEILPFSSGTNTIVVKISDFDGNPVYDSDQIKVKVSNPSKNISAIEIPMEKIERESTELNEFQGELTFGFSGNWEIEVEAKRTENANESKIIQLLIKPRLANIQAQVIEYPLPEDAGPLFPLYDGKDSIWVSDSSAPRLWEFSLETQEFTPYPFDGLVSTQLTQDDKENIWFLDSRRNQIGFINIETKEIFTKTIPKLDPVIDQNIPAGIQTDLDGNIWITISNKNKIVKYSPELDNFDEVNLPDKKSIPFALTIDVKGKVWYSTANPGKIGFIDPNNNEITQYSKEIPLQAPEAMIFDDDGNLWITEHLGLAITKFNPVLETFESISVSNNEALPFGMTFDKYGNIWFAQHVVDNIGVYDPDNRELLEISIPTEGSFVQFMTSDDKGNVWFAEQRGNKIGTVKVTEIPVLVQEELTKGFELKYTEVASPLMALGIIATSLFFVKSIHDKRRLNSLINS